MNRVLPILITVAMFSPVITIGCTSSATEAECNKCIKEEYDCPDCQNGDLTCCKQDTDGSWSGNGLCWSSKENNKDPK